MALTLKLYKNSSPVEKIGKNLTGELNLGDILLKDGTSVLTPVLRVHTGQDIFQYNYMYIPELSRYYFIDDIVSVNNDIWEISGHVDVLETYKQGILTNSVVLRRQENKFNTYLNDERWPVYTYDDVITFKFTDSGFKKSLEYLLVVAGG